MPEASYSGGGGRGVWHLLPLYRGGESLEVFYKPFPTLNKLYGEHCFRF
jgi:hypothetical protein